MNDFASTPELVLLPAVDVADGKAVRLTQGEAGTETNYGDPVDAAARLGAPGRRVDPPRRPRRRLRPRQQHRDHPQGHQAGARRVRSSSPAASATTRRSRPRSRAAPRASTSAPRRSRTPSGPPTSSAATATSIAVGLDVRGTTLAARGWTQDGGDLWAVLDRLEDAGCAATSSPTSPRTARCRARTSSCCARSRRARRSPSSPRAASSSLDDIAALRDLVPLGVEGAIVGKALYAGAFTLAEALDVAGRLIRDDRAHAPIPRASRGRAARFEPNRARGRRRLGRSARCSPR